MAGRGAYKRKAENLAKVRARHDLLIEGIRSPAQVAMVVRSSLIGQRAFVALDLPKLKIKPIALNTLKSLSNEIFTQPDEENRTGFSYLDALRVRLIQELSKATLARTVAAKEDRATTITENLTSRLTATEAHCIKLQYAYMSLYSAINGLIKSSDLQPDAQERLYRVLENHHTAFSNLFEPKIQNANDGNGKVSNLHGREN